LKTKNKPQLKNPTKTETFNFLYFLFSQPKTKNLGGTKHGKFK